MNTTLEQFEQLNRDGKIIAWNETKKELDAIKEREMIMRKTIIESAAPEFDPEAVGTQNVDLGNGWGLKAVIKHTYTLDKDNDKVEGFLDGLEEWQADRLVKWSPRLMKSEYDQLDNTAREAMNEILTIKLASPTLTLVPPKNV